MALHGVLPLKIESRMTTNTELVGRLLFAHDGERHATVQDNDNHDDELSRSSCSCDQRVAEMLVSGKQLISSIG
jgi:hypothetical protein